ncbi:head decoration protein [Agrobacterium vitis]|uniref:head decoration protein n=1 Tax=Agrobacterium vitis TaxID=373 RepID=UPI0012E976F0|nr:head decoration protein [Agrobacterium vitis]MCE6073394.1 head decoration protein [Agrobacterium vitis]MCF1453409.1 head decoration protein [Agrobacterium vitis]MUZ81063.1 head decoration protein [Agrobacterium vitis]MVA08751.1 head decoration protein [Agrobacterium vitis]
METFTEKARPLAFLLSEGNGYISREVLTIASGSGVLEAGTILGKITASGKYSYSPNASVTAIAGAEAAVAILCYGVDATDADVEALCVTNDAEAKEPMLLVHSSVDDATKRAAKIAQLRTVNIKAR